VVLPLLLAGAVFAQGGPSAGHLVFAPTPGARIVEFPRVSPQRIELGIYENSVPIHEQLDGQTARWLMGADAVSVGGGIWFVNLYVERPDIAAEWAWKDGRLLVTLTRKSVEVVEPRTVEPVEALLADTVHRRPAPPSQLPLHPLEGDAQVVVLSPEEAPLDIPPWSPPHLAPPHDQLALAPSSWETIDGYRQVLTETRVPQARSVALYRLATAHLALGHARESMYYLDRLAAEPGPTPAPVVHLTQARAAFAARQWEPARQACQRAATTGANQVSVLQCLGQVSLYTAHPAPTETARALAAATTDPLSHLLAGQLLLKDRRYQEAAELLSPLPDRLEGHGLTRRIAMANLGDALYQTTDPEGAHESWSGAARSSSLRPIMAHRVHMLAMLDSGIASWAAEIPALERAARSPGPDGAEAHYLLAQIADVYDDHDTAAVHLDALIDDHQELAVVSDVPELLLRISSERIAHLLNQGRDAEAAAFYRDHWRKPLDAIIVDTTPMEGVARALEALALYEEALEVQLALSSIHIRYDRDEVASLLHLAHLYALTGRPEEAQEAIDYTRRLDAAKSLRGAVDLIEGHAHRALEDDAGAARAYSRAMRDPQVRIEAIAHLALLRVDRDLCAVALPQLQQVLTSDEALDPLLVEDVRLATARCLLESGREADSLELARISAESTDAPTRQRAWYLASVAATRSGQPDLEDPLEPASELWEALLEEEREATEFAAGLEDRQ